VSSNRRPQLGAPAPAIELVAASGDDWRLADHQGRPAVLIFHRHIH